VAGARIDEKQSLSKQEVLLRQATVIALVSLGRTLRVECECFRRRGQTDCIRL